MSWKLVTYGGSQEGNKAAHHLAKLAICKQLNKVWVDSYPNCLSRIVNAEQLIS
jgi:hypothetical protein